MGTVGGSAILTSAISISKQVAHSQGRIYE